MKCQNPFSGKTIINLLSAVLVRRKVKGIIQRPYIPSRTKWMVIGKLVLNATAGLTKKKKKKMVKSVDHEIQVKAIKGPS